MDFLIDSRANRPGDDPIFSLNTEAKARAAAGESVVNATVGVLLDDEGQLAVLDTILEALRATPPRQASAYAPIAGSKAFLDGVAHDILGDHPARAQVTSVATPGGTGALRNAIVNFLEPGQALLTTSYFWSPYRTLADEHDRTLRTFRMFDADGGLDVADLDRQLGAVMDAQGRALVVLNTPCHNPTGFTFDDKAWAGLRDVLSSHASHGPVVVCLDMAYATFGREPTTDLARHVLPLLPKVLVTFAWSASKGFLQYGLRVGSLVAVCPDDAARTRIQNAFVTSCRGTWSNCNAAGMLAIGEVLGDAEKRARIEAERKKHVELLDARVRRFNELASAAGLSYPRYDGGFFTTVFCSDSKAAGEELKQKGVFVVSMPGALRIALCSVAERDLERLVGSVAEVLKKQPPAPPPSFRGR